MKRVIVIGAGISGLSFGWFLQQMTKEPFELIIVEKSARCGGAIETKKMGSFLFELGPRGFRPSGSGLSTLELADELGLREKIIYADKLARKRYIFKKGRLNKMSLSFLIKNGLLSGMIKDSLLKTSPLKDESITHFIERRLNKKLLKNLFDPLVKGIYGGNPERLSMKSSFPFLWNLEKQHGSLLKGFLRSKRGPGGLASFQEGMQTLPDTLVKSLKSTFLLNQEVHAIDQEGSQFAVHTKDRSLRGDLVILALSDWEISRLLKLPQVIEERVSLTTVNLGWIGKQLPVSGFGFLVPSAEKKELMGMTFDSSIFPSQNEGEITRITAMVSSSDPSHAQRVALSEVKALFGIEKKPDALFVKTHPHAIPQYTLGYEKRELQFKSRLPKGIYALGNCFQGVSVNDCIQNAKVLAQKLVEKGLQEANFL